MLKSNGKKTVCHSINKFQCLQDFVGMCIHNVDASVGACEDMQINRGKISAMGREEQ